jgi:Xaa-Pro aminopeptidase
MAKAKLDAVVATTIENVQYLSDFGDPLPFQTGTGAVAVVFADEAKPSALVVYASYISGLVEEPTWVPNVEVFGALGIAVAKDVELRWPEREVALELAKTEGHRHASMVDALLSAFDKAGATGCVVGYDRPDWSTRVPLDKRGQVVDAANVFLEARAVKSEAEIARLRTASAINEAAFSAATSEIRDGNDWKAVTMAWRREWAISGGTPGFWGGGSGTHASQFYPLQTNYPLCEGDIIRWEGGGWYEGYWADTGRSGTIGVPTDRTRAYAEALEAGGAVARDLLVPGAEGESIVRAAHDAIRAAGISDFPISNVWGHGIGLNLNELPRIRPGVPTVLEPGMVLCFETPYFELGWGGLQLEDTYLITESGNERITTTAAPLMELG